MIFQGVLLKMDAELNNEINYFLRLDNDFLNVNQLIGKTIKLSFVKNQCLSCSEDLEIFSQGYCKSCFFEIPQSGEWIMKPELSKAHLDIEDRDLEYEKQVQLQPHIVYLANSSHLKVGVTRKSQIPTRWIDQGAHQAMSIIETPNRYLAGISEVALKNHVSDKTNWRQMLKNEVVSESLEQSKDQLIDFLPDEIQQYVLSENQLVNLNFPVHKYPEKPKSLNIYKSNQFEGVVCGIKGQYLIFEDDTVFNVRNNQGYVVKIELID